MRIRRADGGVAGVRDQGGRGPARAHPADFDGIGELVVVAIAPL
jgi:hypothetical protein